MKATVNLENMETLGFWFYVCTVRISIEERTSPVRWGWGRAWRGPGLEPGSRRLERQTVDSVAAESNGLGHKGPGMLGKSLTCATNNGEPWKTSEQQRDKEQ